MPPDATLLSPAALMDLSGRLADIWTMLHRGIGLWVGRTRGAPLPLLARTRASRLVTQVQVLLALVAAGRLPRARPPRPETGASAGPDAAAAAPEAPPPRPPPKPRAVCLPRRPGWLMPHAIEIRWAASQLRQWLMEPAAQALLADVPAARRPVAALCRMLGLPPWPHPPDGPFPAPNPRPRKPRPRTPRRSAAEERKLLWHHRSIEIDDGLVRPGRRPWWMPPKHLIRD